MHINAVHVLKFTVLIECGLKFLFAFAFASKVTIVLIRSINFFKGFVLFKGAMSCD